MSETRNRRRMEYLAWAVDENYRDLDGTEYHGYIGIFWHLPDDLSQSAVTVGNKGIRIFGTHAKAREARIIIRKSYPRARVNRVRIVLEPVE